MVQYIYIYTSCISSYLRLDRCLSVYLLHLEDIFINIGTFFSAKCCYPAQHLISIAGCDTTLHRSIPWPGWQPLEALKVRIAGVDLCAKATTHHSQEYHKWVGLKSFPNGSCFMLFLIYHVAPLILVVANATQQSIPVRVGGALPRIFRMSAEAGAGCSAKYPWSLRWIALNR